ncbi:glycogen/starch/alpha-glucan phosphorylase [Alkalibacter mobilis]|uniref:glycogen/starch/alpha-glucan phosphorylase n=1 Tax=Alkalibacter mobilis TaxID=2787712 RepID=UPI0018A096C6|nr:glycogen/starch/alpha-glucan phosphorylase [Alkalibacter mobilis]MBF7095744.1 glycogen/starch/alpha-glucan phosphorylase [Alkalibacter mobilis]
MTTKEAFAQEYEKSLYAIAGKGFEESDIKEKYYALGNLIKSYSGELWHKTRKKQNASSEKSVYYFSMEFLTGKFMKKNLEYLGLFDLAEEFFESKGVCLGDLFDAEEEPGLGNGGLGRLAAAFLDSLSSLGMPGHGYGIRYEKGLFRQGIKNGYQEEIPDNWLVDRNIWEHKRYSEKLEVRFGGRIDYILKGDKYTFKHADYNVVYAIPYDTPVLGYKNQNVNNLRLWGAESPEDLDLKEFSKGNLCGAFNKIDETKSISQVLYPDDSYYEGKKLRLKQEYFLVSAGIQDVVRNAVKNGIDLKSMDEYIAIHINDTHPAMAIPELMRVLMDEHGLEWEDAWEITVKTCAFTNHTLLQEAMEKWDVNLFRELLPRVWQIVEEINNRFLNKIRNGEKAVSLTDIEKLSIISHNTIHMVNLAIVGSHSINGVAKLHSDLLKDRELNHFYRIFPEKFNNKTNGIIHRHWLLSANKGLADLIRDLIGTGFERNPIELKKLLEFTEDSQVLNKVESIKHNNKIRLAKYIFDTKGIKVNPYSIFDIHAKRIHEYKRQFLNILHVIYLYDLLKNNPNLDILPRTFIFAGKAAPGYYLAKEIIKLINRVADIVNNDLTIKDKLKVVFLENYNVSLASLMIPAANVSEQISTTTKEASGTSNMKYMMNGAITLATLDGANIEIRDEVGDDNIVIFGLNDYEVNAYYRDRNYDPVKIYTENKRIKNTVDKLLNGYLGDAFGEFQPLYDSLIKHGDQFFVLGDFDSYATAQKRINTLYKDSQNWSKMSLVNTAGSGVFSSDYTIERYAKEIWGVGAPERKD